jgi:acyl-CoA hydrolase
MHPKSPAESATVISHLTLPSDANFVSSLFQQQHVFGGVVLSLIDRAAGVCSMRHAGGATVTAAFEQVLFREPIRVGELIEIHARVSFVGRTSMETELHVYAEDLLRRQRRLTNRCHATMVAIGTDGRPVPVPPLLVETEEDDRRQREGAIRRAARLRLLAELEQLG